MPNPVLPERDPHGEAELLLPWYATGQLDPADRVLVEEHLASCAQCQRQLALERQLVDQFQTLVPELDAGWARLRSQIETRPIARDRIARAAADIWAVLSRPAVAAFAVAQVAFVIFAAGLVLSFNRPSYHALGSPPPSSEANLIVIFRPDATEEEIRVALRASGASLVGGPTSADAYLLHVPANRRSAALAKLQSEEEVQMAEPIDGAAP
jgi:hypothetical protein